MKKLRLIEFLLTITLYCNSQNKIEKFIELNNRTPDTTISFTIKRGVTELKCTAKSYLLGGELTITIFDPEGKGKEDLP